ncbi:MAG: diadenylate cyclase CdaA [Defluviitaleaceae bacterium]|nr:diadenylate cyclase CdaA [Defluviitaleaceae bacterium]MCL2263039.1 diadenylate cyclase CdaA [Defluviitaleaceae bacterium]
MFFSFTDWLLQIFNIPALSWPAFGPTQALDIFIVAVLLYLATRWIRRTQAWVLLRGLLAVLFVAVLASVFELIAVQWIINNAISVGLLIVVILFQPELRKALEQLGRGSYLVHLRDEGESQIHISAHTVDEILKATRVLTKKCTGALIVLENEVDISEHERRGIPLDAQVSAQLLLNIFEKNAPLHDGAVVIRNNRVSAASCILPLTSESIDAALGTRHRAAIGISEVSDARVIIVSEETGALSLVIDGKLTHGIEEKQMRDLLIWGVPAKKRFSIFKKKKKQ